MTDQEMLQAMGKLLEPVNEKLTSIDNRLAAVEKQVTKTGKQVDVLYNWVDGIDLKVKSMTDIVEHIGQR